MFTVPKGCRPDTRCGACTACPPEYRSRPRRVKTRVWCLRISCTLFQPSLRDLVPAAS